MTLVLFQFTVPQQHSSIEFIRASCVHVLRQRCLFFFFFSLFMLHDSISCSCSDLSHAVLSSQQTPLQSEVTKAMQRRDLSSQRFLQLHQQVSPRTAPPTPSLPPSLPPRLHPSSQPVELQALGLKAEAASLETESNALRQQNRRLAARIVQLQVSHPSSIAP